MPTIEDARRLYPELQGVDDERAINILQQSVYQDMSADDLAGALGVKRRAAEAAPAQSRNGFAVANDTVIEGANAFLGGIKSIGDFASPGNRFSGMLGGLIEKGNQSQSDVVKAEKLRLQQETEAADGVLGEIAPTLGYVARNPLISMAQVAGSVATPGLAVKGLSKGAQALGVGEKAASRAGLVGGSAIGGAMGGGDAAGTAYELVTKTPIDVLAKSPEYQALAAQGMDEASIVDALATQAANNARVIPGLLGAASGAVGFERLLAGGKGFTGGALKRGAKAGVVEAVPEAIEEGATTYEGQAAAAQFNPSINPLKGVGSAATMGGIMGAAAGGAIGAITPESALPSAGDLIRQNLQPETGALAKAVNAGIEAQAQQADATGVLPGAELAAEPEPIDDPFRDRITALPEGAKQEALRAYAVVNNPSAPKGVLNYNRGLLDRLLREDEEARSAAAEAEAAAAPLASPTDTEVTGLLGPVNADPVSGALQAVQAETAANENLANWMQRATPYPIERAQELQALAKEQRGLDMAVVPHSSGSGFTVIPAQWVTPAMRNLVGGALPFDNAPTGAIRVDGQGTAAPETRPQQLATAAENQRRTDLGLPITTRTTQGAADVSPAAPVAAVDTGLAGPADPVPSGSDGAGALPADDRADGVLPVAGTPAPSSEPGVAVGTALAGNSLTNGEVDGAQADQAQQTETQRPEATATVDPLASITRAGGLPFKSRMALTRRMKQLGLKADDYAIAEEPDGFVANRKTPETPQNPAVGGSGSAPVATNTVANGEPLSNGEAAAGQSGKQDAPDSLQPFAAASDETVPSAAEQRQQFKDAEAKRTASGGRLRASSWDKNPLRAFIAKHGISSAVANEFVPGAKERRKALVPGYGPIFRKTGKPLDALAQDAVQEGFLVEPDERQLYSLIERAIRGERIVPQFAEGTMETEGEALSAARFEDYLDAERALAADDSYDPFGADALPGDFLDDELAEAGYDSASDQVKAEVAALLALAESNQFDTDAIREDAATATAGLKEQEYYEDLKRKLQSAIAPDAGSGRNESSSGPDRKGPGSEAKPGSAADRQQATGEQSAAGLTSYTADEARVKQEQAEQAEKRIESQRRADDERTKKDDERKRIAQASVAAADSFELGGDSLANLTGQKDIFAAAAGPEPAAPPSQPTKPSTKSAQAAIEDFGEKLVGARKDYAALLKDAEAVDVSAEPLSKSWPEPDYQKLLASGVDPFVVGWVRSSRDEVPTKPQKAWKLKGWVESVKLLRSVSGKLLDGSITKDALTAQLSEAAFRNVRDNVGGRAELYQVVGHEKSLKGLRLTSHSYTFYKGQEYPRPGKTLWHVEQAVKATAFGNWPREIVTTDTREQAVAAFKEKFAGLDLGSKAKAKASFVIYSKRGQPGAFIGKKIGREYVDLHKADDLKAARAYLESNTEALEKALARYKDTPYERSDDNAPRVGADHRGGALVTPQVFSDTFGFRGVQFGNYVEQGRRQSDLNEAYDALMDMAAVLELPPRALSLGGRLGLAFGARGKGGKNAPAAHYEPGLVVINLTKGGGPGSLAHEWFHAMDNYFAKEGGTSGFMTEKAKGDALRAEMRAAFMAIRRALQASGIKARSVELDKRRTTPYWSTPEEMAARTFESYVIAKLQDQSASNDYLANVVSQESFEAADSQRLGAESEAAKPATYPYPTEPEMAKLRTVYDEFFKTVQTKQDEAGNTVMFSREARNELGQFTGKADTIRQIVETVSARWKNPPGIVVIDSMADAPSDVTAEYERQNSQGADGEAEGFYHRGKVYLVASALNTPADVTRVLFHETLGHAGLRGVFGDALAPILDQIATLRGDLLRPVAERYGFNLDNRADRLIAAEEVLAFLAQTKPETGYVKRAIAAIRTWLRANIPGFAAMKLSDAEIVNNFILPARQFVERGNQRSERRLELEPAFGRREQLEVQLAPAIVGGSLGSASALPMYEAAKGGDVAAAAQVAKALVTPELTAKVRQAIGDQRPVVVPVASIEATGRNKIPLAAAEVLAKALGLKTADGLVQSNSPKRTALNGLDRIFAQPEFDGEVEPGQSYVLVGGTLTQGATFAALASHIQQNGGRVLASVALTGKTYSATLTPNPETLKRLREKYVDLEPQFQAATGFGFDGLTQSEARYLANFEPTQSVRDRIVEAGNQAGYGQNPADAGPVNEPGSPPVFSRTADPRDPNTFSQQTTDVFNDLMASTKTFNGWWHKSVGTQYHKAQKDREFKRVYDSAQSYIGDVSKLSNDAADLARDLLPRLNRLGDVFKGGAKEADVKAIGKAIFQGTLGDKREYKPSELKQVFGLTEPQIKLYEQFRAATNKSLDVLTASTIAKLLENGGFTKAQFQEAIDASDHRAMLRMVEDVAKRDPKAEPLAAQVREVSARADQLQGEGYAPLMRFGQYAVSARDAKDNSLQEFYLFETQFQANRKARELESTGKYKVDRSIMSQDDFKLLGGISPESLELFGDVLAKAGVMDPKDAVFEAFIRNAVAQRSAMKRMLERQGYPGYSTDLRRVLAAFITSNARLSSKNLHFSDMLGAAESISKSKGDVRDEATKLVNYVQNPEEEAGGLRSLLFVKYIGGSVASALVNLTQSLTMTLPYLSQFTSPLKASGILTSAMNQAATGVTDPDLKKAMAQAEQSGLVSPQEIHHLNAEAMQTLGSNPAIQKALFVWGSMFGAAEQYNRRVAFIAGWNTALAKGEKDPYAFAQKAVEETQGVYNKGNRPNWARGAVGATLFTFKQFSISYMEFLTRLPNREKALALAILMLAAGAEGLPFADDLDDVIDTIAQKMGYSFNSKQEKRRFLAGVLGQGGSEFALKGLSALPGMPIDVAGRMGMANLLPGTGVLREDVRDHMGDVFEFLGPAGGVVKDVISKNIIPGSALDVANNAIAPTAVRNLAHAIDMFQTGKYRDKDGRKVVDIEAADAAMKMIGFQPARVARDSLQTRLEVQDTNLAKNVEQSIAREWALSQFEGDTDGVQAARERMREWNEKNPDQRIVINTAQIAQRLRQMRQSRADRIIKSTPKELRPGVREALQ